MKKIPHLFLIVLFLFACDFDIKRVERITVSGEIVKQEMNFDDFSEIVIAGPIDIVLDQNGGSGIEIETYESLMELFRAEMHEDALVLYLLDTTFTASFNIETDYEELSRKALLSGSRLKWPNNEKVLKVHLSFTDIEKIQVIGECDMRTAQTLETKELKLEVAGALHLEADLEVESFNAEIAGAGNLNVQGKTKEFHVECAGAGTIRAYEFIAENVKLEIAGVCNAQVYAGKSIDAEIAGMGTIRYKGNPEKISFEKAGIGSMKSAEEAEEKETEI
ncbi:MAG: head GIN domain-containing protein [Candidatus Marinimicrobia bacterium]|nr:head GIN domain-containing protein [Candidatus Neomarinimicrobiota bacterium]